VTELQNTLTLVEEVAAKIEDFYILCIYDHHYAKNQSVLLQRKFNQSKIIELPEVNGKFTAKSFVIWSKTYEQNEALFYSIRMQARQETVVKISKALVAYYIEQNPTVEKKLKNPTVLDDTLNELQTLIRATSFLSDEEWIQFYVAFKNEVRNWVIESLLNKMSIEEIRQMEVPELNYLFFYYMSSQLALKAEFMTFMIDATNRYLERWLDEIISELSKSSKLQSILGNLVESRTKLGDFSLQFTVQDHLFVMNNLPYQIVREAIYKKAFQSSPFSSFPTANILKGNTEGQIEFIPISSEHQVDRSWQQVKRITDIDVDVFDALCNLFLSKKRVEAEVISIPLVDLLHYRGLKPKRSGDGRRGGYDAKQKLQIIQSLSNIQSIKMNLTKLQSFEKGKPKNIKLEGRTFLFKDENGQEMVFDLDTIPKNIHFSIDTAFSAYLSGAGRQVALQHKKALHYHPTQQLYEKRLCRYLSWRWRIQARKGNYLIPNTISTILDSIGVPLNERLPSRTRERLERALDQLQEDQIIQSWQYDKWDEGITEFKGWSRIWLEAGIIIEPPEAISSQYATIERKSSKREQSIQTLKEARIEKKFSLLELAEDLEIHVSELSEMERGKRPLSKKVSDWMQK